MLVAVDTDRVILLDERGQAIGTALKEAVHSASTPLHRAFSCYLLDARGRVLMTRRALSKRSWPGVWTNSFCGHPAPGEDLIAAVRRHGLYELSVYIHEPRVILPDFRYRAVDSNGIVENEVCPVLVARTDDAVLAHTSEVAEWEWVAPAELIHTAYSMPHLLSPWSVLQLPLMADALESVGAGR